MGLFTAILLYPAIHELSHSLATIVLGGTVIEFHLFPLPNMLCDGNSVGKAGLVTIGLCGMFIPFLIAILFNPKHFTLWYIFQLIKCISLLAFLLSIISLFGQKFGLRISNDDIITVLELWPDGKDILVATLTVSLLLLLYTIYRQHPMRRLYKYFGMG